MKKKTLIQVDNQIAVPATPNEATEQPSCEPSISSCEQGATTCEDSIRQRAYEQWQAAGCPEGDGVEFWLVAERELISQATQDSVKPVRSQNDDTVGS